MHEAVQGILLCCLSAFAFGGVMYVPFKRIQIFDGVRFQFVMNTAVLAVGFASAFLTDDLKFAFEVLPLVGGCMYGSANFILCRLLSELRLGVFIAFVTAAMPTSYLISRFGVWGVPKGGDVIADCGVGVIFMSLALLTLSYRCRVGGQSTVDGTPPQMSTPISQHFFLDGDSEVLSSNTCARTCICIVLALAAGVLLAFSNVPVTKWNVEHQGRPLAPVLPMFLGIWIASAVLGLLHELIGAARGQTSARIRVSSASACGAIWGLGYTSFILAVSLAGFEACTAVAFVGSTIVSGFITVLWYKDVSGRRAQSLFFAAATFLVVGLVMVARPQPLH